MTAKELKEKLSKYNIPDDAILMSDSGWECDATDMDGIYYNEKENIVVFTQYFGQRDYDKENGWIELK